MYGAPTIAVANNDQCWAVHCRCNLNWCGQVTNEVPAAAFICKVCRKIDISPLLLTYAFNCCGLQRDAATGLGAVVNNNEQTLLQVDGDLRCWVFAASPPQVNPVKRPFDQIPWNGNDSTRTKRATQLLIGRSEMGLHVIRM